jgi:hypothetical protein
MKRTLLWMTLLLTLLAGQVFSKQPDEPTGKAAFFYSSLSPYGGWIRSEYGYAWRPHFISHGWRPYLNGQWVWTDYGWYWVSSEPFGWATYHYGRWQYDDYYGWIWIPDDVWGPAWVEWRYNDDYVGWAPLSPQADFSIDVGITFQDRWTAPLYYWNFVPCRYMTAGRVVDYIQPIERTRRIFGSTRGSLGIRADGDRVVNRGIDVGFVERRGNIRVNRVDVVQRENGSGERFVRDANRDRVEMYRPHLERQNRGELAPPAPVRAHNDRPSAGSVGTDRNNRNWQGTRAPTRRDQFSVPPHVGDTRPRNDQTRERVQTQPQREQNARDRVQYQHPRDIGRDIQRREPMREQRQPQGHQMQGGSRGQAEKAPQRDSRHDERKPRP